MMDRHLVRISSLLRIHQQFLWHIVMVSSAIVCWHACCKIVYQISAEVMEGDGND
jgi:hypothetical protein